MLLQEGACMPGLVDVCVSSLFSWRLVKTILRCLSSPVHDPDAGTVQHLQQGYVYCSAMWAVIVMSYSKLINERILCFNTPDDSLDCNYGDQ